VVTVRLLRRVLWACAGLALLVAPEVRAEPPLGFEPGRFGDRRIATGSHWRYNAPAVPATYAAILCDSAREAGRASLTADPPGGPDGIVAGALHPLLRGVLEAHQRAHRMVSIARPRLLEFFALLDEGDRRYLDPRVGFQAFFMTAGVPRGLPPAYWVTEEGGRRGAPRREMFLRGQDTEGLSCDVHRVRPARYGDHLPSLNWPGLRDAVAALGFGPLDCPELASLLPLADWSSAEPDAVTACLTAPPPNDDEGTR